MKLPVQCLVCVFCGYVASGAAAGEAVNPIQQVLEMISSLEAKVIQEGLGEQKNYEEFAEWCEDRSKQLHFDIKTEKANIVELKAAIADKTAKIDSFGSKIESLAESIGDSEAELKKATALRETEAVDFGQAESELMEIIGTIERASTIIEREMHKGSSFAQLQGAQNVAATLEVLVQASAINSADADRLTALLQGSTADSSNEEDDSLGSPDAAAYENHSGNILESLDGLRLKAEDQLADARKDEADAKHNYELKKQALEDEIKNGNKDMNAAKKSLAENQEGKATAEGEMEATTKDIKADTKSLGELHHDCMSKAAGFQDETKSRGEELKALAAAKKIISEATGGAATQTYGLDQVSLLQVSAGLSSSKALGIIRRVAFAQKSASLAQLASRIGTLMRLVTPQGLDPFAKVKGLIADMAERLEKEAEADATHKQYCDKELSETDAKKEDKSAELEKLGTKTKQMLAHSAKLRADATNLQNELSALAQEQAEMDKLRQDEHTAFAANKPEMEKGLDGIKQALNVLREYYAKEDEDHDEAGGAGSGIIGLLEVAESDFSQGLADMTQKEERATTTYEAETKGNAVLRVTKEQDRKFKSKEAAALDKALSELESDSEVIQVELNAVLEYLKQLETGCVARPEPYEERVKRRDAELAGLKDALETLSGEAALDQQQESHATLRGGSGRRQSSSLAP